MYSMYLPSQVYLAKVRAICWHVEVCNAGLFRALDAQARACIVLINTDKGLTAAKKQGRCGPAKDTTTFPLAIACIKLSCHAYWWQLPESAGTLLALK